MVDKSLAKPKAMVYGIGNIGRCIASYMTKLGYEVVTVDIIDSFYDDHPYKHYKIVEPSSLIPQGNCWPIPEEEPDIVISALPYFENWRLATYCIDNGYRYCDLGGSVSVSKSIWGYAEDKATMPVFTDLGLAPGWVNIVAEQVYRKISSIYNDNPEVSINMFCGGFATEQKDFDNILQYGPTWSIDGLVNEYIDDCEVIENHEVCTKPGMNGYKLIAMSEEIDLECFYTSGGMARTTELMHERGVKNCSYRTLRFPGHIERVKVLLAVDEKGDALRQVLESLEPCTKDAIYFRVEGHDYCSKFKNSCVYEDGVTMEEDDEFSAMASATSAACCSVADLMGRGHMDGDLHHKRKNRLTYDTVDYYGFMTNMAKLINFKGKEHDK